MELKTIADYHIFFKNQGFQQCSYAIYQDTHGVIIFVFSQQKFKIWWKKRKLLKLLQQYKMVTVNIEIAISLGITPWSLGDFS
jgi:hypothetical protein